MIVPQESTHFVCKATPQRKSVSTLLFLNRECLITDAAKFHEREHLEEGFVLLIKVGIFPLVLFSHYGTGVDRASGMQAHQIELMVKPVLLLFDARCLVVEYHGDQVEFGVRPHVFRFIDEDPKVGQGTASRYRNGGEYPRRRVDQGLFDQSVNKYHKDCILFQQ